MKRVILSIFLASAWLVLAGMSKSPIGEIPKPEKNFTATIIDNQHISTKCEQVSLEGETYFIGEHGKGTLSIPFQKVKKVHFIGNAKNGKRDARITMKGGEIVAVTFDAETRLYGVTEYGSFRITLENVEDVIFK